MGLLFLLGLESKVNKAIGNQLINKSAMKVENYEKIYYCRRKNRSRKIVKNP